MLRSSLVALAMLGMVQCLVLPSCTQPRPYTLGRTRLTAQARFALVPLATSLMENIPTTLPLNDTLSPTEGMSARKLSQNLRASDVLIVFLVDASSTASAPRMAAVRGAALSILKQPYHTRTKVSIIPFKGMHAQVLLPPTGSISLATQRLRSFEHGGGSPLAHALHLAAYTGMQAIQNAQAKQVLIMCLSDGRANIPLSSALGGHFKDDSESWESASSGRDTLRVEVLAAADNLKKLNGRGVHFLMVDTDKRVASLHNAPAQKIAAHAGGHYVHAPRVTDMGLIQLAADSLRALHVEKGGELLSVIPASVPVGFEE